jgi:hypothetical protein
MAESATPARRRARRPTRISRQLAEARERNAAQLTRQREQEKAVEEALAEFFGAGEQIAAAEADTQRKIEPHERAIAQLREQLGQTVGGAEAAQARAALTIHEADRTVEQVGELLGLGEKAARRLISAGRDAATAADTDQSDDEDGDDASGGPAPESDPGEGRDGGQAQAAPPTVPDAGPPPWPAGQPGGQQPLRPSPDRDLAASSSDTASG